jgi:pimeloyl-ACP methyl ester carboxylesterase
MKANRWIKFTFPVILIIAIYFLGPAPDKPVFDEAMPEVPRQPDALEKYIQENERRHVIKPDNQARIIWNDSSHRKTEYAVIYLHGFSASQKEGDPVHQRFAANFGCNLFLSRLADHGIDTTERLLLFTADRFWESAKEALAVGNSLGEKVIIISTSSGGTLALMLAARYPDRVHALINLSPNIAINDPAAFILNDPWGLQIARVVMGGKYRVMDLTPEESQYWSGKYRLESLVELQELLESGLSDETFKAISQPTLTLYYYKNEIEQDPQVKVSSMLDMHKKLGTPESKKIIKAMPDAGAHVMGSSLTSKDIEGVYAAMEQFAIEQLKLVNSGEPQLKKDNISVKVPR